MKILTPIKNAPIGRNQHMSISHRRDNPFIMAVIARHNRWSFSLQPIKPGYLFISGAIVRENGKVLYWLKPKAEPVCHLNKKGRIIKQ